MAAEPLAAKREEPGVTFAARRPKNAIRARRAKKSTGWQSDRLSAQLDAADRQRRYHLKERSIGFIVIRRPEYRQVRDGIDKQALNGDRPHPLADLADVTPTSALERMRDRHRRRQSRHTVRDGDDQLLFAVSLDYETAPAPPNLDDRLGPQRLYPFTALGASAA
jgi:hypothetical protein